jgi:hypothetical protein
MKWNIVALVLVLGIIGTLAFRFGSGDSPDGKTVMNLTWDGPAAVKITPGPITVTINSPTSATFVVSSSFFGNRFLPALQNDLFRIPNPPVRSRYTITGIASYENMPNLSELLITACYLNGNYAVDMDRYSGANMRFVGTSGLRRFIIPMDTPPAYGRDLLQLDVSLVVGWDRIAPPLPAGAVQKLTLSDLKVVSYPDSPANAISASAPSTAASLDWKSFLIGTAATAILGLAMAQGFVLVRRLRKLKADREIRQMSSLDG